MCLLSKASLVWGNTELYPFLCETPKASLVFLLHKWAVCFFLLVSERPVKGTSQRPRKSLSSPPQCDFWKHRLVTFLRLGCGCSRPVSFRLMRTCRCRWAGQHVVVSAAISRLISLSLCVSPCECALTCSSGCLSAAQKVTARCLSLTQIPEPPNFPGETWEHFVFGEKNNNSSLCVNISLHILACLWLVGWCLVSCHSSKQDQRLGAVTS